MIRALALTFALLVAACGAPTETPAPAQTAEAGLTIADAWASPTPGGVAVSAGYLTIANAGGADDRLVAASSPRAERVEIHEMAMDAGVMQMRQLETLAIPAGGEATLAPGGRHLMFIGVTAPFAVGEDIPVRLRFERAGEIELALPVRPHAGGDGH